MNNRNRNGQTVGYFRLYGLCGLLILGDIVIKHIEEEDRAWEAKDRKREKRRLKKEQAAARAAEETSTTTAGDSAADDKGALPVQTRKPPRFY